MAATGSIGTPKSAFDRTYRRKVHVMEEKPYLAPSNGSSNGAAQSTFVCADPGRPRGVAYMTSVTRSPLATRVRAEEISAINQAAAYSSDYVCTPTRIAIGSKLSIGEGCLILGANAISLECCIAKGRANHVTSNAATGRVQQHVRHTIRPVEVNDFKFFVADETEQSDGLAVPNAFCSLRVKKTDENQLTESLYSNVYLPDGTKYENKFIVVEFTDTSDLDSLLAHMMASRNWAAYRYADESGRLNQTSAAQYAGPLVATTNVVASKGKEGYPFLVGKADKATILVFPFDGNKHAIEVAAKELTCLGGMDGTLAGLVSGNSYDATVNHSQATTISFGAVTLTPDDFLRLEPGVWLNDNLIDFALRWIARNNDGTDTHFFSTYFYIKLADYGVGAVASWTSRKNREINIFEKKMVFIPINKALHWSLCVIINPGKIKRFSSLCWSRAPTFRSNRQSCHASSFLTLSEATTKIKWYVLVAAADCMNNRPDSC